MLSEYVINSTVVIYIDRRWNDGEKAFPLKKRRGSCFATNSNNDNNNNTKKKMKTNTKKKYYDSNEEEDHKEEEVVVVRETKQKKVRSPFSQILINFRIYSCILVYILILI